MAPNQTCHRKCYCGREFICGDAIETECCICRTKGHVPGCDCFECRQAEADKDWERQLLDYRRSGWDYWSDTNE